MRLLRNARSAAIYDNNFVTADRHIASLFAMTGLLVNGPTYLIPNPIIATTVSSTPRDNSVRRYLGATIIADDPQLRNHTQILRNKAVNDRLRAKYFYQLSVENKMPKITYIDFEGTERNVDGNIGDSVMETATNNDIPGIDADCGGACACATCHVYVSEDWTAVVGKPEELEAEMLDVAEEVTEFSRLSCQIKITEEFDGLVVTTPESQF